MRFFIALEIPPESRHEIERVQSLIAEIIPEARLTNPEKLHLTVAFIGEQSDELKDDLIKVLANSAQGIAPFSIAPAYIDGFPHLHQAKTLWIGVKGDIDRLMVVRERVKDGLLHLDMPVDERRYVPHIAIAKLSNFDLTEAQEKRLEQIMSVGFTPIQITNLKLFESVPSEGLHSHNTLAEVHLG